jgi:carbon storage regulator
MLVLSRKLGEKICIGQNIFLTVVDIERGKVRLGIEAPREIPIYRQELLAQPEPNPAPATEFSAAPK